MHSQRNRGTIGLGNVTQGTELRHRKIVSLDYLILDAINQKLLKHNILNMVGKN